MVGTRVDERHDWTLAPDVSLADPAPPGRQTLMAVRSPRLARRAAAGFPAEHILDDVVEMVTDRTYRLVGRGGKTVNINGRRADLRVIETALQAAVPAASPVCLLVDDPVRGEWYEVRAHGGPGEVQAVEEAAIRLLPSWQAPRAIRAAPPPAARQRPPVPLNPNPCER